jgi:predicted DCC family thiol-disulfide oxidoreductase YuxK
MTEVDRAKIIGRPVLLYDGVCALCNGVVRFVLKRDKVKLFRFAALESKAAQELLAGDPTTLDGVALVMNALTEKQRVYRRSDATAEALRLLGWTWLAQVLAVVPRPFREAGYSLVAGLRYKVFGKYEVCPIPTAEDRGRFVGIEGPGNRHVSWRRS